MGRHRERSGSLARILRRLEAQILMVSGAWRSPLGLDVVGRPKPKVELVPHSQSSLNQEFSWEHLGFISLVYLSPDRIGTELVGCKDAATLPSQLSNEELLIGLCRSPGVCGKVLFFFFFSHCHVACNTRLLPGSWIMLRPEMIHNFYQHQLSHLQAYTCFCYPEGLGRMNQ